MTSTCTQSAPADTTFCTCSGSDHGFLVALQGHYGIYCTTIGQQLTCSPSCAKLALRIDGATLHIRGSEESHIRFSAEKQAGECTQQFKRAAQAYITSFLEYLSTRAPSPLARSLTA